MSLTIALARVIQMVLILVLFGTIETVLTRRYPYVDGSRLNAGDKFLWVVWLLVIAQPLLLPAWGLAPPPLWMVLVGWLFSVPGLVLYYLARRRLGSHSANPAVPTGGYMRDGIYKYFRHPMYVSFVLLATGIGFMGASVLSPILVVTAVGLYFGYKARREEALRAQAEKGAA